MYDDMIDDYDRKMLWLVMKEKGLWYKFGCVVTFNG